MERYNDNYTPHKPEGIGAEWILVEMEHHILRNRRESLGLTQQEVANKARVQLRQYQRLESGERSIYGASFRIAISVCKALQLDPQRFIDGVCDISVQEEEVK